MPAPTALSDSLVSLPKLQPALLVGGLLSLTAIVYGALCYALYAQQGKLIFRPSPLMISTPAEQGLPYEDVWIPVGSPSDTTRLEVGDDTLHGWWVPCLGSDQVLLFCHGNYGNISYNLERIRFYHELGFSVLAFDYRGYGQSPGGPGKPSEQSTYEDARAAWDYLICNRQIAPERITVCGHSMGGAIAIHLAHEAPEMARLIVKSSFTTMKEAVDAKRIYSLFPVDLLLEHPFDSLSKVKHLQMPVLYIHGEQDPDIPAEMSDRLYAATPGVKHIWLAPGADHNGILAVQREACAEAIKAFCDRTQPTSSRILV